ncbi:MAG: ADP-glyceromanno-heptose 6-epimerase [Gemmatimonadota bacterium]
MPNPVPFTPDHRILVTGGAGFIGSALVWQLNAMGCERVVIADRLGRSDKWRNLAPLRFEDYLEADDLLPRLESGALGRFTHVLHMGACSSTLERDATFLVHNNFEFTKRVAAWSLGADARFVYASSAATYGDGSAGMSDDVHGLRDLTRLRPLNAYGYSKQLFDQHALAHGLLGDIVGLKFFNVFGPNEAHKGEMRSLVHKAYEQIRDTGRVGLFKSYHPDYRDGEQRRDFVYVKDVAAMTLHLASQPAASGLYNIGSGIAHTWLDLTGALFAALGKAPSIDFIEMPEVMRGRYQYFTQADITRARTAGFAAEMTPLSDAIADYVTGYLVTDRRLGDETPS